MNNGLFQIACAKVAKTKTAPPPAPVFHQTGVPFLQLEKKKSLKEKQKQILKSAGFVVEKLINGYRFVKILRKQTQNKTKQNSQNAIGYGRLHACVRYYSSPSLNIGQWKNERFLAFHPI